MRTIRKQKIKNVKKKAALARKGETRKEVRKEEKVKLTKSLENILWCLTFGPKSLREIASQTNLDEEDIETELEVLQDKDIVNLTGGLMKKYELTNKGSGILGTPAIKLDAQLTDSNVKSGQETLLLVNTQNVGQVPLKNSILKIVSPRFINVTRQDSDYDEDDEKLKVEFPLTQLNPGEAQGISFRVKGDLTSGTLVSKYKIQVKAVIEDDISNKKEDKKEVEITVQK